MSGPESSPGQQPPPYGQQPPHGQQPYGQQPHYGGQQHPGAPSQLNPNEERNWALGAHLSGIVAGFVGLVFLGPLLVLLIQGGKSPFVRAHAVEALNFAISTTIYGVAAFILVFVLIGFLLLPAVVIFWFVCTILASMAASRGEAYRYPLNIRMVS